MKSNLLNEIHQLETELKRLQKEAYTQMIIEGVDDPGILKCVFMAGGPGSGKSFTAKEIFGVGKNALASVSVAGLKLVNSDIAFEKGLKDNGINPKELGTIEKEDPELWDKITKGDSSIRGKAKAITKKQQDFYEAGRLGMIIDGTGDEVEKIKKKMEHAKSLGYDCYMVFVNTSLEVALERNRNRDRVLSDDLVTTIWKACQDNLGKFQTMFSGNFVIVDNTVYKPINSSVQKAVDAFVRKPLYNPIGKKWVANARALKKAKLIEQETPKLTSLIGEVSYDFRAKRFLDAIQVVDRSIKDLKNITVDATPRGNWTVYHKGRVLTTINGKMLDDDTIMKYGLEHYD